MTDLADLFSWVFLCVGGFFTLVGGIGVLRLPDMYARLHAAGVTDMLGASCVMIGLMFQIGSSLSTVKLLLLLAFFVLTSPAAAHVVAKCALHKGDRPEVDVEDVDLTSGPQSATESASGEEESSTS